MDQNKLVGMLGKVELEYSKPTYNDIKSSDNFNTFADEVRDFDERQAFLSRGWYLERTIFIAVEIMELKILTEATMTTICTEIGKNLELSEATVKRLWQSFKKEIRDLVNDGRNIKDISRRTQIPVTIVELYVALEGLKISEAKKQSIGEKVDFVEAVSTLEDEEINVEYLITPSVIVIVHDAEPINVPNTHPKFEDIKDELLYGSHSLALKMADMKATLADLTCEEIVFDENGNATYKGHTITNMEAVEDIIGLIEIGDVDKAQETVNFLERLMHNPSNDVVNRIKSFCKASDIAISSDGFIIAYKVVRADYFDKYSGTMDNSVGKTVEVLRNSVDENQERTCSYGLHVCAANYIPHYGYFGQSGNDRVVEVRVDPADIVAIPEDYNDSKVRCCKYEVIRDVTAEYEAGRL